jgi:ribosomal protein S18 acetylase RimI-like enzyme
MEIRLATEKDYERCVEMDMLIMKTDKRKDYFRRHIRDETMYVALEQDRVQKQAGKQAKDLVAGLIAFDPHFIGCLYISLLLVHPDFRRGGIARKLVEVVAALSKDGRLFSSTEEDNEVSLKFHEALGFRRSGYIENLPQPTREIILFREVD